MPFNPPKPPANYPVTGIPLEKGEHPGVRQEVRDLKKDVDTWNLYLLGLWQFQLVPTDNPLSYYRIAGIHGLPYKAWPENNTDLDKLKVQEGVGFCTHTSILFLPWHRPYLALFESVLRDALLYVAEQYTEEEGKQKYLAAAKKFRMPYWDWARQDLDRFPKEATDHQTVSVKMPRSIFDYYENKEPGKYKQNSDGTVIIPNALFSWPFLEGTDPAVTQLTFKTQPDKSPILKRTTRWFAQGSASEETAKDQGEDINNALTPFYNDVTVAQTVRRNTANLGERLNILINGYDTFAGVSNNDWATPEERKEPGYQFGSFEDIHNSIHVLTGGTDKDSAGRYRKGQMSNVPQSAFDPIFWLHHTNIDRALSMWQALHYDKKNPDTWVVEMTSEEGNWGTPINGKEGLDTKLLPFYKNGESFYLPDDVRDTTTFGYGYPETESWLFPPDGEAYRRNVRSKIAKLYPTASLATLVANHRAGDPSANEILQKRALSLNIISAAAEPNTLSTSLAIAAQQQSVSPQLAASLPQISLPDVAPVRPRSLDDLIKGESYLEWLVNVKAPKHAQNGDYQVHIFLGEVPEEEPTSLYVLSPYQVGSFVPLGQPEETQCEKCKKDQIAGKAITGQIPLTIALAERFFAGKLESLEEQHVVPYLQENLHWEVVGQDGQRYAGRRNIIDGLLVGVVSSEVTLPTASRDYPVFAPHVTVYPQITTKASGRGGRGEGTGITDDTINFQV